MTITIKQLFHLHIPILFISAIWMHMLTPDSYAQSDPAGQSIIYLDRTEQVIRGFGAANIVGWRPDMTNSDIEVAFGTGENQLGMSILRLRIPPNENQWNVNLATAQKAHEMGVTIIASPWSPPANMKTNNNLIGGHLRPDFYGEYAAHLNRFVEYMEDNGVPIYAVSVQNEPDIQVSYESCDWTPEEMTTFLREHSDSIKTKIIAPESFQFRRPISDAILNDPAATANLDIVGGHIYGGGLAPYPLAEERGKEIWMTEYLLNMSATDQWGQLTQDVIWEETVEMLKTIQSSMKFNWNAYIWWYLKRYYSFIGEGDQGTSSGEILKRGYAFSQFSRFIRPGSVRIETQDPIIRGYLNVSTTAYIDSSNVVIVAINAETSAKELTFTIEGGTISMLNRYVTSQTQNVEQLDDVEVSDNRFTVTLEAKSVTTFSSTLPPVSNEVVSSIPGSYELSQNYPNPFNPSTVISFQLPVSGGIKLEVFDMLGRKVAALVDERVAAGFHQVSFDASHLPSGIYIYRLRAGDTVLSRRMTLIK